MYKAGRRKKRKRGAGGPSRSRFRLRKQANDEEENKSSRSGQNRSGTSTRGKRKDDHHDNRSLFEEDLAITVEEETEEDDRAGLKWNFIAIRMNAALKTFPFIFDYSTGEEGSGTVKCDNTWRIYYFYAWMVFVTVRIISIVVGIIFFGLESFKSFSGNENEDGNTSTDDKEGINSEEKDSEDRTRVYEFFVMVIAGGLGSMLLFLVYYIIFILKCLNTICIVYNSTLNLDKEIPEYYALRKAETRGLKSYKRFFKTLVEDPREILLTYLPFCVYLLLFMVPLFAAVRPNSPLLLTALVANKLDLGLSLGRILRLDVDLSYTLGQILVQWKFLLCYIFLTLVDYAYYFYFITIVYLGVVLILVFMHRMQRHSQIMCDYLREDEDDAVGYLASYAKVQRLETAIRQLKLMKLQIILFNSSLSLIVYLAKVMTLVAAIIGGLGFIKLFSVHLPFAMIFLVFFFEGNFLYTILFNSTYQIGENVEALKSDVLAVSSLELSWTKENVRRMEIERFVKSIQELGIKAGGFHFIERESTLYFFEFVVEQIVDLLLAF